MAMEKNDANVGSDMEMEDDMISLGDGEIEDLLETVQEELNDLDLTTAEDNEAELRERALSSLRKNRNAKQARKREQSAKQQKLKGNGGLRYQPWGMRMMRQLGIKDIRPMLELRKRQKALNINTGMRIQMLKNAGKKDMVVVRNRVWRYQEIATMKRWTLIPEK